MRNWSLEFTDAALEQHYTTKRFTATYAPTLSFCLVNMVLVGMLSDALNGNEAWRAMILTSLAMISALRFYLHSMEDQQHARILSGRWLLAVTVVTKFGCHAWYFPDPPEFSPVGLVLHLATGALIPIYLRHSALAVAHRLLHLAVTTVDRFIYGRTFLCHTSFLGLGPGVAISCFAGVGLLSEVLGFLVERRLRTAFIDRFAKPEATVVQSLLTPSTARICVHPWTLEYDDATFEAEYTSRTFRATCVPSATICAALLAMLSALLFAAVNSGLLIAVADVLVLMSVWFTVTAADFSSQYHAAVEPSRATPWPSYMDLASRFPIR